MTWKISIMLKLSDFLRRVESHLYSIRWRERREILRELKSHILERAKEIGDGIVDKSSISKAIIEMGNPREIAENYVELEEVEFTKRAYWILILNAGWSLYITILAALVFIGWSVFRPEDMNDIFLIFFLSFPLALGVISLVLYLVQNKNPDYIPALNPYTLVFSLLNLPFVFLWPPFAVSIYNNFLIPHPSIALISIVTPIAYVASHLLGSQKLSRYNIFLAKKPRSIKGYKRQLKRALSKLDFESKYFIIKEMEDHIKNRKEELRVLNEEDRKLKIISELELPSEAAAKYIKLYSVPLTIKKKAILYAALVIASISFAIGFINTMNALWLTQGLAVTFTFIGLLSSFVLLVLAVTLHATGVSQLLRPSKTKDYWRLTLGLFLALLLLLPIAFSAAIAPYEEPVVAESIEFPHPVLLGVAKDENEDFNMIWYYSTISKSHQYGYGGFTEREEFVGIFLTKLDKNGNKLKEAKLEFLNNINSLEHFYYINHSFFIFCTEGTRKLKMLKLSEDWDLIYDTTLFSDLNIHFMSISPSRYPIYTEIENHKYSLLATPDNFSFAWMTRDSLGNDSYEYTLQLNSLSFEGELDPLWTKPLFTTYEPREHEPFHIFGGTNVYLELEERGVHIFWSNYIDSANYSSENLSYKFIDKYGEIKANITLFCQNVSRFPVPQQNLGFYDCYDCDDLNGTYARTYALGYLTNISTPNAWIIWNSYIGLNGTENTTYHLTLINSLTGETENNTLFNSIRIFNPYHYEYIHPDAIQIDTDLYAVYHLFVASYIDDTYDIDVDNSTTGLYVAKANSDGAMEFNKRIIETQEDDIFLFLDFRLFSSNNGNLNILWIKLEEYMELDYQIVYPPYHRTILSKNGDLLMDEKLANNKGFIVLSSEYLFYRGRSYAAQEDDSYILIGPGGRIAEWTLGQPYPPIIIEELIYVALDFGNEEQVIKQIDPYFHMPNETAEILASIILPVVVIVCFQISYQRFKIKKVLKAKPAQP